MQNEKFKMFCILNFQFFTEASLCLFLGASLTGCLSPIAMHRAVLEYDRTVSQVDSELLLLNIARARHYRPVHFTAVSSVAATFDFRAEAGITGGFGHATDSSERPLNLSYSTSVSENPTVTIIPISGEEFTKRILRPLEEYHFEFLYHQGFDISMLLRLMGRGILLETDKGRAVYLNQPGRKNEFVEFRRRLLHLAALDDARKLYVESVSYEEAFPVALDRAMTPAEVVAALEKGYRWSVPMKGMPQMLTRKVGGRVAITNYELRSLTNDERQRFNEELQRFPEDYLYVDIRPGNPGGEYPIRGVIQLRSFNAIISFVARGIAEERGFHVDPDPRSSMAVTRNPDHILEIDESPNEPSDAEFTVPFEGKHYSIRKFPISGGMTPSWNQEAFSVLANLFQMTVTDVTNVKTPIISIPKG